MKGTIFVSFMNHLDEKYGPELVEAALEKIENELSSGGAYTAVGNYPHQELLSLAATICELGGTELEPLIRAFASFLLADFQRIHPEYFDAHTDIFEFLAALEDIIHADVRKIYPDARPPRIVVERTDTASNILLHYRSSRPFALLAMALTESCGRAFGQPIDIDEIELSPDQCSMTIKVSKSDG